MRHVVTIGNFDGVHLGHQAILRCARAVADSEGARLTAMTFDPHPATVLRPEAAPAALTSAAQRQALLAVCGADEVQVIEPTEALLGLSPRDFVAGLAADREVAAFVEGPDFRFGAGRSGDVAMLRTLGLEMGFEVVVVDRLETALHDRLLAPVSSTLVRWLLAHGRVGDAALALGRLFELQGQVVRGDQRGRTLGVPTANLDPAAWEGRMIPGDGVYAGEAVIAEQVYPAAISIGVKPTFAGRARVIEAHLLDFAGDLYGQAMTLRFGRWLREQAPFPSVELLRAQLLRDVGAVRGAGGAGGAVLGV